MGTPFSKVSFINHQRLIINVSEKMNSRCQKLLSKQTKLISELTQEAERKYVTLSDIAKSSAKSSLNVSEIKDASDSKEEFYSFYSESHENEAWKSACSAFPGLNNSGMSQIRIYTIPEELDDGASEGDRHFLNNVLKCNYAK